MPATTVRVSIETRNRLRDLAAQEDVAMQVILDRAVEGYRRARFLEAANQAFAALRADAQAWRDENAERGEWDRALGDGIQDES